jgi:hypothetical protein
LIIPQIEADLRPKQELSLFSAGGGILSSLSGRETSLVNRHLSLKRDFDFKSDRLLDGISEGLFSASEFDQPSKEQKERNAKAGKPLVDLNLTLSHECEAESFNDGNDGIQSHDPLQILRYD